jgi:Ca2+-binding EF-hand superfamily protein
MKLVQLVGQNPTKKQMNDALESCSLTHAKELTLQNCEAIVWSVWYEMDVEAELRSAFSKFDKDQNGYLDANEFKSVMLSYGEKLSNDEFKELMKLVDLNHDGKIDYEGKC